MKYCASCQDYINDEMFQRHMSEHARTQSSDYVSKYKPQPNKTNNDYFICLYHQKKFPCPVKKCKYSMGIIRHSELKKQKITGYLNGNMFQSEGNGTYDTGEPLPQHNNHKNKDIEIINNVVTINGVDKKLLI